MRGRRRKQDLFANLPPEFVIDILSRLPVGTIISCKCVCKSWLALLETPEFVNLHLLRGNASLTLYESTPDFYRIFEFEERLDVAKFELKCRPVIKFNLPFENGWIVGSIHGLFLCCYQGRTNITLSICNPITRDYILIHHPEELLHYSFPQLVALGLGASKISGQHKVVAVFNEEDEYKCYVYTIETGEWREIEPPVGNLNGCRKAGVFLDGNLHWLVSDFTESKPWIVCFDLETEMFSTLSTPIMVGSNTLAVVLCALEDTLCLCDNRSNGIDIWLMKEYGVEISWTKQFNIHNNSVFYQHFYDVIYPFKVFKDGDVLMAWKHTNFLFYYSERNRIVSKNDSFELCADIVPLFHRPSFLSLRSFARENVRSF